MVSRRRRARRGRRGTRGVQPGEQRGLVQEELSSDMQIG
jgi:hypothetical protein